MLLPARVECGEPLAKRAEKNQMCLRMSEEAGREAIKVQGRTSLGWREWTNGSGRKWRRPGGGLVWALSATGGADGCWGRVRPE